MLILTLVVLVNLTPIQNYLARKGADYLSKTLKTKVEIAHIRIDFLNHLLIQGLYIQDQQKDTLLYAGEAQIRISDWFIFKDKPVLKYLALQNAYAHLYRTASSKDWNYGFIEDAFNTGKKKSTSKNKPFEFDLQKIELENVRFHMDDKWVGEDLDFDFGKLYVEADVLDFTKKALTITDITIRNSTVSINEYKGGRPPKARTGPMWEDLAHKTPFNDDNWAVAIHDLMLDDCTFRLTGDNKTPEPGVFDENHLIVRNIELSANAISITGDTLHGNIKNLSGAERCGIVVKSLRSKVSVSPNATICTDLFIETNYSKVGNYYAMHYKHFPDFTSYIDSVTMVARLRDAVVDKRDIEFFAPQLREFPNITLKVSGNGKGTVADLSAKNLTVTDGTTAIKGDITMKGLPDIYSTYITYSNGEILTNGTGILRYIPSLKNSPNIALENLLYAYFKGSYKGYIENFAVNGTFNTNLGSVTADLKMNIPGFNSNTAVYSGSVVAENVQVGNFLKQPLLGNVTLKEDFSGRSFNPDEVQMKIDGTINEIGINGYNYRNIITHGVLAKKQFDGTLLVDDPNLALTFDGGLNYSNKNIIIKATAHLLNSNFNALKLTKDTITLSADFDLNCTGSNMDNFSGFAKLNNIDLKKNARKLAIDSIEVNATGGDTTNKYLSIKSNDFIASIKGNYQLSKLPGSIQYYLSRYIPNYIQAPEKYAPDQNFEFRIATTNIDSILALTFPLIRGFNSSTFSGSLNTDAKKLTLNADVPSGSIGSFHMHNVTLTGLGNLDNLGLSTTIENVVIGDSIVSGSLSLTTTVSNDSVAFTIATTSPDTGTSISLNGQIIARRDSLFLTVLPSQFYLNAVKWDIAGGSKIVYSDKYLLVQGFSITSGFQKITANTELQNADKSILINTENLDLGQFGTWAGLAVYQPDGRVNGTIRIDKLFNELKISANIKATDVKFGADTLGTINLVGDYDGVKKLVTFDPQTGIFRGGASVTASGKISLDSNSNQKLDGALKFKNTPVVWASPFLIGIMSHLSGTVNGTVGFKGTSFEPELDGTLTLLKAGLRLDYMGTNYAIPYASVHIDNKRIDLGKVMIFDRHSNFATLSGYFSHNLFNRMRMRLAVRSDKFEVMNLASYDNNIFYGNLIAGMDSLTIRGAFDNVRLNIVGIRPVAKSRIYIPISSGNDGGTYSYVSFKTYGTTQGKIIRKSTNKIRINIEADMNSLAEMHIVLDPVSGDEIEARGDGKIYIDIPSNNDIQISGTYVIDNGTYKYSFKDLIHRQFVLESGSTIGFHGLFESTDLNVDAIYRVKAKLIDLLSESEKSYLQASELTDAQTPQWVALKLKMSGLLNDPKLTFDLGLEDKRSQNTVAYQKLRQINNDARQQFSQVGSLLLVGQFMPPEGIGTGVALSGAVNNISQILSSSVSTGLTSIINKLTGDKDLNVAVKYTNYNSSDVSSGGLNRNQIKLGVNKSYFNDRLLVEVGSTSDWGRPASANTTSGFNLTGDFRIQYKITPTSGVRLNAFRASDYDVTRDRDIVRSGVGVTWRKSFDNLNDFFRGRKFAQKQKDDQLKKINEPAEDTLSKRSSGIQK